MRTLLWLLKRWHDLPDLVDTKYQIDSLHHNGMILADSQNKLQQEVELLRQRIAEKEAVATLGPPAPQPRVVPVREFINMMNRKGKA